MFVKVFSQILDSSIASNYELRHFFEDMLKLADSEGVVDMTPDAIARRINLPEAKVVECLKELESPDPRSRTKVEDGRRIVCIDSERGWGWRVVNYQAYRAIKDEEARRAYFREAKRRQRLRQGQPLTGEVVALRAEDSGDMETRDRLAAEMP